MIQRHDRGKIALKNYLKENYLAKDLNSVHIAQVKDLSLNFQYFFLQISSSLFSISLNYLSHTTVAELNAEMQRNNQIAFLYLLQPLLSLPRNIHIVFKFISAKLIYVEVCKKPSERSGPMKK